MESQSSAPNSGQPSSGEATSSVPSPSVPPTAPPTSPPPAAPPPSDQTPSGKSKFNFFAIIGVVIALVGLGVLAYLYFQTQSKQAPVETVKAEPSVAEAPQKVLVVGIDPTYQPMEFLQENKLTGYDVDLANFIGKELGAQIEFKQIVFDDLFPALEKKDIDMIISTVTVTEERKKKYGFSEPYLQGGQVILTKKDNATITTTADLKGKKIAVQKGTTIETEALKYTTDNLVIRYPDFVQATAALAKGDVDAIFADLPGAKGITNDNPTLKIASDPFTQEYYAIVFRSNDPSIQDINKALSSLKVKGILADLKQQWLEQ